MIHRMMRWLAVSASLLTVLSAGVSCAGASTDGDSSAEPSEIRGGGEAFRFESLKAMVGASELIAKGVVKDVGPGRVIVPGQDGEPPDQLILLTIGVDRVFSGSISSEVVLVEEFPFPSAPQVGDTVVYFLSRNLVTTDQTVYYPISSTGRFVEKSDSVIASNDEMQWVKDLAILSPERFEQEIAQAVAQV